ncbi:MAG: transporter [Clostridiales bacterium]|nr:MAG: transporter [Clostridiales bacterium]
MTYKNLKKPFIISLPIALGYIPLGIVCGMLLNNAGLNPYSVVAMSFLVFAGSSQFVAASMLAHGATLIAIVVTTFIINLRQLIYSSSLANHLTEKNPLKIIAFSQFITDETFAINSRQYNDASWSDTDATLLGLFSNLHWVIGNLIGALFGKYLGIPTGVAGFALTAMFIALLALQIRQKSDVRLCVIGAFSAIAVYSFNQSGFSIIISTAISVLIAAFIDNLTGKAEVDDE